MKKENNTQTRLSRADSVCQQEQSGYLELLTRYEEDLLKCKNPDPHKFLEKCPDSEKAQMVLSLNLSTLFLSGKNKIKKYKDRLTKSALEEVQRRCYANIVKNHR